MRLQALYTLHEAAQLLGVSRHALRRMIQSGKLQTVQIDEQARQSFVPLSSLLRDFRAVDFVHRATRR